MTEQSIDVWKSHVREVVIKNMKDSIECLEHENLPDHIFNFSMQSLQNGIRFLVQQREEGIKEK